MIDKMYSLKELGKKFGVPYMTLYRWVRAGKLKGKQDVNRFMINEWYVSESDWLEVPTFIRNRYKLNK